MQQQQKNLFCFCACLQLASLHPRLAAFFTRCRPNSCPPYPVSSPYTSASSSAVDPEPVAARIPVAAPIFTAIQSPSLRFEDARLGRRAGQAPQLDAPSGFARIAENLCATLRNGMWRRPTVPPANPDAQSKSKVHVGGQWVNGRSHFCFYVFVWCVAWFRVSESIRVGF